MSNRFMKLLAGFIALLVCVSLSLAVAADKDKGQGVMKTNVIEKYTWFTINNLFNWYGNNGNSSFNKVTGNSGLEFPKGTSKTPIYEDGVVWGGYHKGRGDPKVGGSVYRYAIQAGAVTGYGGALEGERPPFDDPLLAKYRPYRVRPDVGPSVPFSAVQDKMEEEADLISRYNTISAQAVYDQYILDWNEWPAIEGLPAPYTDVNGNKKYDPATDIPGQPGADQTIYYVGNDLNSSLTVNLSGSPPIGLEMHRTVWGYNLGGALGNTIFASTLIINKSGAPLDTAYFVQWSDPDLGDSGDDYAGCDVGRSLGFIYNGKPADDTYGKEVPAAGYDFFQGPIVPGSATDSAVFQLKYRKNFKNLGMSTFVFFINGSTTYGDPAQGSGGDIQWYRLMKGTIASSGSAFINPITKQPTVYTLDGDPVSGQGWLDGTYGLVPGDRRICLVTGPFTMANRDTQELVTATIVGLGADRISSIAVLKWYSDLAQSAYNQLFNIPRPPPTPLVAIGQLDGELSMTWADSVGNVKVEAFNSGGYAFEGYNVYQFPDPSPDITRATRLATYDLVNAITTIFDDVYDPATGYILKKPVQFGTDAGLKRAYRTETDAITKTPLRNGTTYYFGVTSYSFNSNPTAVPTQLESSPTVQAVVPQWETPGTRYASATGDTLPSAHAGPSDGLAVPVVVNPTLMKKEGATYKIDFQGAAGTGTWSIARTWNGKVDTVAKGIANQNGDDLSPIIDGIQFRVVGAPLDFKHFLTVANKNGAITPFQQGCFPFNGSGFPLDPEGTDRPDGTKQQSAGLTASQGWGIHTGMNSTTMGFDYTFFKSRVTQGNARWSTIIPYDWEIRFTAAGSKALFPSAFTGLADSIVDVPFELWNTGISTPTNTADDYRLFPYILDVDGNFKFNLLAKNGTDSVDNGGGGPDHSISGGDNDPFTDWVYWVMPADKSPGQAGYNAILAGAQAAIAAAQDPYLGTGTNSDAMRRMVIVGWNVGSASGNGGNGSFSLPMPEAGTVFRIISTKPNSTADSFTITAAPADQSSELAQADADRVNVFPNPYVGFNPQEQNKYQRFVTFTHLPRSATLRIFNLAGVLVRTLVKNDPDQFFQWDLRNEDGFPVAAGMYIVYIDMPEVGKTKTLKLGVIPEQQFLDRW